MTEYAGSLNEKVTVESLRITPMIRAQQQRPVSDSTTSSFFIPVPEQARSAESDRFLREQLAV